MAVGDVFYYGTMREGRRHFALHPGTYLVLAKGHFNEDPPDFNADSFGAMQLYFGYGRNLQQIDEAVVYLGAVPQSFPTHYSEPIEGGGASLEVVIDVEAKPQPGRLMFQALCHFSKFHSGKLVIMEVKRRRPPPLGLLPPLTTVTGVETLERAEKRLRKPWQGKPKR